MIFFVERNWNTIVDSPNTQVIEWFYDTVNLHPGYFPGDEWHWFRTTTDYFIIPPDGSQDEVIRADGTLLFSECDGGDKTTYIYDSTQTGSDTGLPDNPADYHFRPYFIVIATAPSSDCCPIPSSDFTITKSNNTNAISPDGFIRLSSAHDPTEYEASIDGGATYPYAGGSSYIEISPLYGGDYSILLRNTITGCILTFSASLINTYDSGTTPSINLAISIIQTPDIFVPVFLPVIYQFAFINNTFTIKSDGRTYIDAGSNADLKTFLSQLPYVRIIGSTIYNVVTKVTDVDNAITPTKFYITLTYVSDEVVQFTTIDRQIFQLFGETDFNVFTKIADVSVAADTNGIFLLRCEGFLQSLFEVLQPSTSDDISLGRKFYCIPRDFDLSLGSDETNPILTAVFGTQPLASFIEDLVPLGPTPINFIDRTTGLGYPILFSFLNDANQRVTNVISGSLNDIVTANEAVYIQALPGNTYTLQWISHVSFSPVFVPALPDWITILNQTSTSITIQIQTFSGGDVGDYGSDDYSSLDYSIDQLNAIQGCYTFRMYDGSPGSDDEPILTLTTCIFPTQLLQNICGRDLYNIAWVNLEGGWNSFIFKGVKKHGRNIGAVSQYKKVHELKKSSVEEVYDQVEVGFSMKGIDELEFITMLRTSIQAYLFNDVTQFWDIPIFIDKSTFPTYQTPFRQGEQQGSFIFRYANEVLVQRQ